MKPGHVNFFDGMRVSAEHMDHLQGSLHSAIADLRGLAGVGRVHEGLEVTANGDGTVTVAPGWALDYQRNRIVCDEPRLVTPEFAGGQSTAYVCLAHVTSSTGVVEDVATLIWDGCRVVVRPDRPTPEENQVIVSRVRLLPDGVGVEVEMSAIGSSNGARSAGADLSAPSVPEEIPGATLSLDSEEPPPTPDAPAPGLSLAVQQGIAQLRSLGAGLALTDLAARIGAVLERADTGTEEEDPVAESGAAIVPAGSATAPLDFLWRSISCRGPLRVWWGPGPADGPATPGSTATLLGEATFGSEGLAQHSLQTVSPSPPDGTAATTVVADSIGHVALSAVALPPGPDSGALGALLDRLEWRLRITPNTVEGFEINASIGWKGGVDEQALRTLAESPRTLAWDATLAWKAFGRR